MRKLQRRPFETLAGLTGEASGALGDLGTFLPYVVAALAGGILLPGPLFAGFAAGYLMVAVVYRIPVSVQPMKALGAALVAGGLSAAETAWAGAVLGAILLAIAMAPGFERALRAIPQSVVTGLQVGLGLTLGVMAYGLMAAHWPLAAGAAAVLALAFAWPRGPWALLLVGGAVMAGPWLGAGAGAATAIPARGGASVLDALALGVLPQLPLTLLNAVVLAAAVSRGLHGARAARVGERRLMLTTGALNLAMAPFGAMPMCHGAGGIAAHHRFGARGIGAPLIMAVLCAAAALSGPGVVELIGRIPQPVIGALLLYAAADLAFSRRLIDARPDCRPVIGAAALATLAWGAAAGLAAGLVAELVRSRLARGRSAWRRGGG